MDWFERLTRFREKDHAQVQQMLEIDGELMRSKVNGCAWRIGRFEMASLAELRQRAGTLGGKGKPRPSIVQGDVRGMHSQPDYEGALFQVASQFNALEMVGPAITPEHGVARYEGDPTQGPACAMAAGAATIYRNYFVPVGGQQGQTAGSQVDGLSALGSRLSVVLGLPVTSLWDWRNGYALCRTEGVSAIGQYLGSIDPVTRDNLRALLRIGLHLDVEVTDGTQSEQVVSQAFCSALPVAYGQAPADICAPFARLVLEAAYEATLLQGVLNARRGRSDIVLLTLLGGGVFGNDLQWIFDAIRHALDKVSGEQLDVRIVSYRPPSERLLRMVQGLA
jgi:hypothetical protein